MKPKELAFTNMVPNEATCFCVYGHVVWVQICVVGVYVCVCVKARGQHQVIFLRIQSP